MSVDEGADILSRLGILQSTLKSPHRKSRSQTQSMDDDSSSSDDCLFETERISITRSRILRRQHRGDEATNASCGSVSRTWVILTLFYLLFVFAFNSSTTSLTEFRGSYDEASRGLFIYYVIYTPAFLLGIIIAGSVYKCYDTMMICATLLAFTIFGALVSSNSRLTLLTLVVIAICSGVTQRGCILAANLIKQPHRLIFGVCLTLALATLVGSLINIPRLHYDNNVVDSVTLMSPTMKFHMIRKREIHGIDGSLASISRVLATLPADNSYRSNRVTNDVRSFSSSSETIQADGVVKNATTLLEQSTRSEGVMNQENFTNLSSPVQSKNVTLELTINGTSTTFVPTSTTDISERVFKTKTEENKVMRQEAERKRKEKEEALKKSATTTTITTATLNITSTTPTTITITSTVASTTVATTNTTVANILASSLTAESQWPAAAADRLVTVRRGILNTLGSGDEPSALSSDHLDRLVVPSGPPISSAVINKDDTLNAAFPSHIASESEMRHTTGASKKWSADADIWRWPSAGNKSTVVRFVSWTIVVVSTVFLFIFLYVRRFCLSAPVAALSMFTLDEELLRVNGGTTLVESNISCVLSFSVWFLLFAIEEAIAKAILFCSNIDLYGRVNELYQFLPLFWSAVAGSSVLIIAWNKYITSAKSIHVTYGLSLATCLLFSRTFQLTSYSNALVRLLLIGVECSIGPWLVAAWLTAFTRLDPFALSSRLAAANVVGKAVAAAYLYNFSRTEADSWQTCLAETGPQVHAFVDILLPLSYVLFIVLSYTAQRADRQRQIIQLSDEINGRQQQRLTGRKRRRRRAPVAKNGQYVALVDEERDGDSAMLQLDNNSDEDDLGADNGIVDGRPSSAIGRHDENTDNELSDEAETADRFRQL